MPQGPVQSPYVMTFGDYLYDPGSVVDKTRPDHAVQITLTFNNTTRVLTNAVVWRAANCRWTRIVVGFGPDGIPDSSAFVFNLSTLSDASRTITAAQMAAPPYNVHTVEEFMQAGQITAAL